MVNTAPPPKPARRRMSRFLVGTLTVFLVFCVIGVAAAVAAQGKSIWSWLSAEDKPCIESSATVRTELDGGKTFRRVISPDGSRMLVQRERDYALVDSVTGRVVSRIENPGRRWRAALSTDGAFIAAHGQDDSSMFWGTAVWSTASGKEIQTILDGRDVDVAAMAISPDGKAVATGDSEGSVRVWNVRTGGLTWTMKAGPGGIASDSVAFSPDGDLVAAADRRGTLFVWDAANGETRNEWDTGANSARTITVSPDGKYVALLAERGPVTAVEPATGRKVTVAPTVGEIAGMQFSADSSGIVTTAMDGTASRTSLADGKTLETFKTCAPYLTSDLMIGPGGQHLISLEKTSDGSGYELVSFPVP